MTTGGVLVAGVHDADVLVVDDAYRDDLPADVRSVHSGRAVVHVDLATDVLLELALRVFELHELTPLLCWTNMDNLAIFYHKFVIYVIYSVIIKKRII